MRGRLLRLPARHPTGRAAVQCRFQIGRDRSAQTMKRVVLIWRWRPPRMRGEWRHVVASHRRLSRRHRHTSTCVAVANYNNKKLIRRWDNERKLFNGDMFNHFYAVRPLRPTWVHNWNGKAIGSAVFAQMTAECPYTLQWATPSPQNCPFPWGSGPHVIHGSFGPPESSTKWHLDWLSHFAGLPSVTDLQTNSLTLSLTVLDHRRETVVVDPLSLTRLLIVCGLTRDKKCL